mmetsp:Transcript_91561/g.274919  ORF Transcript_91561/g.274919 Transcript_91561/m.274919 type:complete len:223 (-) Transcript_91561:1630-2298(-)
MRSSQPGTDRWASPTPSYIRTPMRSSTSPTETMAAMPRCLGTIQPAGSEPSAPKPLRRSRRASSLAAHERQRPPSWRHRRPPRLPATRAAPPMLAPCWPGFVFRLRRLQASSAHSGRSPTHRAPPSASIAAAPSSNGSSCRRRVRGARRWGGSGRSGLTCPLLQPSQRVTPSGRTCRAAPRRQRLLCRRASATLSTLRFCSGRAPLRPRWRLLSRTPRRVPG